MLQTVHLNHHAKYYWTYQQKFRNDVICYHVLVGGYCVVGEHGDFCQHISVAQSTEFPAK